MGSRLAGDEQQIDQDLYVDWGMPDSANPRMESTQILSILVALIARKFPIIIKYVSCLPKVEIQAIPHSWLNQPSLFL